MRCILWGLFTFFLASADLHCKTYMEHNYDKIKRKVICDGWVELRQVENKGMAMGIGENHPETTRMASGLVCLSTGLTALSVWRKKRGFLRSLAIALTLAGAISNTYDRFVRRHVVDYFGFRTRHKKFNRVTFNLADMFIFAGGILQLFADVFGSGKRKTRRVWPRK